MFHRTKAIAEYTIAGAFLASSLAIAAGLYAVGMTVAVVRERLSQQPTESKQDLLRRLKKEIDDDPGQDDKV